jgi:hypothetical protein
VFVVVVARIFTSIQGNKMKVTIKNVSGQKQCSAIFACGIGFTPHDMKS